MYINNFENGDTVVFNGMEDKPHGRGIIYKSVDTGITYILTDNDVLVPLSSDWRHIQVENAQLKADIASIEMIDAEAALR